MHIFWKKYVKIASSSSVPFSNRRLLPVAGGSTSRSSRYYFKNNITTVNVLLFLPHFCTYFSLQTL